MIINLNDRVKVKLTQEAKDLYRSDVEALHDRLMCSPFNLQVRPVFKPMVEDAEGYVSMQLWAVFTSFGKYVGLGRPNLFELKVEP